MWKQLVTSFIFPTCRKFSSSICHVAIERQVNMLSAKPTAGIIIIGDEIIKGQVKDTNSHFLCQKLYKLGVKVEKITIISDDVDTIAKEIAIFSKAYTYVLTSGGIGTTHDDVTFAAIAKAFGETLERNATLVDIVKKVFGNGIHDSSPEMRLAEIPQSSKLNFDVDTEKGEKNIYPLISVRNVYIFPGVPQFLERLFEIVGKKVFYNPNYLPLVKTLYLSLQEMKVTPYLNEAVKKFEGSVAFGSYPEMSNSYYKVRIVLESQNDKTLEEAEKFLIEKLPPGILINYEADPISKAGETVYSYRMESLQKSIEIIESGCFKKHNISDVCVCFNGGKDCTALLHIVYAVFQKHQKPNESLNTVYIRDSSPFLQLEEFIHQSAIRYNLNLITLEGPIKEALQKLRVSHPNIKVAIMGTRRTDPYSETLNYIQETDGDWPKYLRVFPVLDWTYHNVWQFIRDLTLPYCILYDRGYTSIGNMENTYPNPSLQYHDERGQIKYHPAYELNHDNEERKGRE